MGEDPGQAPPCLFSDIMDLVPTARQVESHATFLETKQRIFSSTLRREQWCNSHHRVCRVQGADLDCSGLPCVDNSRIKKGRLLLDGETGPLFVVWALRLKRLNVKLAILENTLAPLLDLI